MADRRFSERNSGGSCSQEIFYPELVQNTPMLNQLRLLISDCIEEEADVLIPIIVAVLSGLREKGATAIQIE